MRRLLPAAAALILTAAVCVATPGAEEASPTPAQILSTDLSGGDLNFFDSASRQVALIAGLSAMARDRAITPEVKALAASIAKEQSGCAAKLKDLAGRKHVPMDAEVDGRGKNQLQTLAKMKGPKFDKGYLDALGDAQEDLQKSLEAGAASADADIKALAQADLATLKQERGQMRKLGI